MNETSISTHRLIIASMWSLVLAIKATAWIVALTTGNWGTGVLIALLMIPACTAAGVAHIRSYACRVSRQVRVVEAMVDVPMPMSDLHPVR